MGKYYKAITFVILFWVAVVFSKNIILPFSNEFEVSGPLTSMQFNPLNNTVRFLFIVFSPLAVYTLIVLLRKIITKRRFLLNPDIKNNEVNNPEINNQPLEAKIGKFEKIVLLIFFAFLLFYHAGFSTFNDKPLDTFHDGESLGPAISYINGEKPYGDNLSVHGVFQDPGRSVIAFKLFGKSISSYRLFTSMLEITSFLLFFLALFFLFNLRTVYGVFAGIILFLLLDVSYNVPFRDISTYLFIIFVSLFYYNFINVSQDEIISSKRKYRNFCFLTFFCFFIPIASFANSIDRGIYSLAGVFSLFLMTLLLFFKNKKIKYIFSLSAISGVVGGVIVLNVVFRGALYEFFHFTFVSMPSFKELIDAFEYEFSGRNLVPVFIFSAFVFWIGIRFLIAISNKNIFFWERVRNFIRNYYLELFLLSLSLAFFKGALGRCDIGHILYVSGPLFMVLIYALIKNNIGLKKNNDSLFFLTTAIIFLVVAVSMIYKHDPSDEKENWWKFSTKMKDEQVIPNSEKNTIDFLKRNLKKDEYFYTMTSEGAWYYFVNKPCPIRINETILLTPNFFQKEAIEQLKEKGSKVKYIIYRNNLWTNNFDFVSNEKRYPYLIEYIKQNYEFYKMIDDQEIWIIKEK